MEHVMIEAIERPTVDQAAGGPVTATRPGSPAELAARPVAQYAVEWRDDLGAWHEAIAGQRTIATASQHALDVLVDSLALTHRRRKQPVRVTATVRAPAGQFLIAYSVVQPLSQRGDAVAA
jgi:hypothetical protein